MRGPVLLDLLVLLTVSLPATAQMDTGDTDSPLKHGMPTITVSKEVFISGKVVLEDGSLLPDRAEVETVCDGQKLMRARTDSHGSFSFSLSSDGGSNGAETQSAATGADNSWRGPMAPHQGEPNWQGCELQAVLAGFRSEKITLGRRIEELGENNLGQVVLHRTQQVEGLTISVTTALAPEEAKKAFRKGLEQASKNNWEEAQTLFEKAVQIYPQYAVAWFELGRVAVQRKDKTEAERCWEQAVRADPKYVPPYQMLGQIAAGAGRWLKLVEVTAKWLAAAPDDFADAWYLNAVGNYFAAYPAGAEASARQGIKLDAGHRIPKLEYLLGMILMQEQAFAEAAEHMQLYLRLVSKPADVNEAQKQLAEIERLSASANGLSGQVH